MKKVMNDDIRVHKGYATIPKLYDRENKQHRFTGNMKLVYSTILSFEANKQKAYLAISHLCGLCSLSDSGTRQMLSLMEGLGLIKRKKRPGMADTYSTMPITEEMINGYHGLTAVDDEPLPAEICEDEDIDLIPCQIYLQKLYAPFFSCLKVGIAKDTLKRVKEQKTNSMFKHQVLKTWNVKDRNKALEIEGVILKEFERSQCLKEWLPDGATETLPIGVEDEVINKINMLVSACNSQL